MKKLLILIIIFVPSFCYAESVSWIPKGEPTVEDCMKESKQSKEVCEAIVQMWFYSRKIDEVVTGSDQSLWEDDKLIKQVTE